MTWVPFEQSVHDKLNILYDQLIWIRANVESLHEQMKYIEERIEEGELLDHDFRESLIEDYDE